MLSRNMQNPVRSVAVLALAGLVFFSGCENAKETTKIAGKSGKMGGGVPVAGKPVGQDPSNPADDTPAEVLELLKILTQGHQIFRETWFVATSEILKQQGVKKDEPGSAFRRLGSVIDRHRHGHWEDVKSEECNQYRTQIVRQGDFKDKSKPFVLTVIAHPGCDPNVKEVRGSETWATFQWSPNATGKDQHHIQAIFNRQFLSAAFGPSVAFRAEMGQVDKVVKCEIDVDASLRIREMDCPGLSQNIAGNSYFEFSKFVYGNPPFDLQEDVVVTDEKTKKPSVIARKGDKLSVWAVGKLFSMVGGGKMEAGDSGWTAVEEVNTPIPQIGKIVQKIELLSVNAQEAYDQMKKDAEREEAAAPAKTVEAPVDGAQPNGDAQDPNAQQGANPAAQGQGAQQAADPNAAAKSVNPQEAAAQAPTLVPGGEPVPNAKAQQQAQAQAAQESEEDQMNRMGFSNMTPEQQQAEQEIQVQAQAEAQAYVRAQMQEQAAARAQEAQEQGQQAQIEAHQRGETATGAAAPLGRGAPNPAAAAVLMPTHDPVTGSAVSGDFR